MAAAAIIFFAFYGFDAISTAAEETKNPGRDLPIGIVGSMVACTAIYVAVAAVAVGAMPFARFANSPEPLALILRQLGQGWTAIVIGAAAVIALPTVILAFLYGQSRIFFVMARDGLLPAQPGQGEPADRRAGAHDAGHRDRRGDPGRPRAARPDRLAGQRRHAGRLHRRLGLPAGAAPARARPAAHLPHAAGLDRRAAGDRRLPLPVLEPAAEDPALLRGLEPDRAGLLLPLAAAQVQDFHLAR